MSLLKGFMYEIRLSTDYLTYCGILGSSSEHFPHWNGQSLRPFSLPYNFLFCSLHLKAYLSKKGLEGPTSHSLIFPTHQTSLLTCEQQSCPRRGITGLANAFHRNGFHWLERDSNPGPSRGPESDALPIRYIAIPALVVIQIQT